MKHLLGVRRHTARRLGSLASVGLVLTAGVIAAPAGPAHAVPCNKSWTAAVSGSFADGTKWTPAGAPGAADDICITVDGTYTVTLTGSASVASLKVGSAVSGFQTLSVLGGGGNTSFTLGANPSLVTFRGRLVMNSTGGGYSLIQSGAITNNGVVQTLNGTASPRYLRTPITNNASGQIKIDSGDTRIDAGAGITNAGGTVITSATGALVSNVPFVQNTGTLTNNGAFTQSGSTFTVAGGTTGGTNPIIITSATFTDSAVAGTATFNLTGSNTIVGTIPATHTINLLGTGGNNNTTVSGTLTNNGNLKLDSTGGGFSLITGGAITNNAVVQTLNGTASPRYLRTPITNNASGQIKIDSGDTRIDAGAGITNAGGTVITSATGALVSNVPFVQNTGTLTNNGAFTQSGSTFTVAGGTTGGTNPIIITSATFTDSAVAGTATFNLTGSNTIVGTIPATHTINLLGTGGNNNTTVSGTLTNNGNLKLNSTGGGYSLIQGGAITNNGVVQTLNGTASPRYLRTPITNNASGQIKIDSGDTRIDAGAGITNAGGTVITSATGAATSNVPFVQNTGTLTNNGAFTQSGSTFTVAGGTTGGTNPIIITSATFTDSAVAGTATFNLTGSNTIVGTIPATHTINLLGTGGNTTTTVSGTLTNNGNLVMDSTGGGYSLIDGGPITNNGTFTLGNTTASPRYLRVPVANNGNGLVRVNSVNVLQDGNDAITNNGRVIVGDGGHLFLSGGSSVVSSATATLGFTVNAATGISQITGGPVTLGNAKLRVDTIGNPVLNTVYTPVSGATVTGTFTSLEFGAKVYTFTTTPTTVTVKVGTPFTLVAKNPAFKADIPTTPSIATVTDATPAASYTVTVDWGDSTQSAGNAIISGTGANITGKHNYAAVGTYIVTTTVHGSDGTTITKTGTATVTLPAAPTVTSVVPAVRARNTTSTITINGTNLTQNFVPTFSNPGVTVLLKTWISATKVTVKVNVSNVAALGAGDIGISTIGGATTCVACFTVTPRPTLTTFAPSPVHGATTTVNVTGTGFQPGLIVTSTIPGVTFGAITGLTATTFSVQITVPIGTPVGPYQLTAKNVDLGQATKTINVL